MPFYNWICVELDVVKRQRAGIICHQRPNNSDFEREHWAFRGVFCIVSSYAIQEQSILNRKYTNAFKNLQVTYVVVCTPECNPLGSIFTLKLRIMYISSKYLGTLTHGASLVKHKLNWKLIFLSATVIKIKTLVHYRYTFKSKIQVFKCV